MKELINYNVRRSSINSSRPDPGRRDKINLNLFFTLLCGASKSFMKALKAFIKPCEAPQRSVKIKIYVNFYLNTTLRNARGGKG